MSGSIAGNLEAAIDFGPLYAEIEGQPDIEIASLLPTDTIYTRGTQSYVRGDTPADGQIATAFTNDELSPELMYRFPEDGTWQSTYKRGSGAE
ncbi:MAG: phenylalanine-4-hydroxylase [Sphingomonas bacterium]|uniref:hypothetical protein n=1 Tax=Sphingomonas bacterium TaxID=1895847 RepID=UPI00261A5707|nr:hypothetical protein [Sphingomonas bacterium]MDB5706164.1 phenylalanine-4-hydroxylase [Sphingomonas bacterium]